VQYILQFTTLLLLPLYFIASVWKAGERDILGWSLKCLVAGAFLAYVAAMGRWDLLSYYARYAFGLLYLAALLKSGLRVRSRPLLLRGERGWWYSHALNAFLLVTFGAFFSWAARGWFYSDAPVNLQFPLASGWYYVGHGGNSPVINYHNVYDSQRYALDIVELNSLGTRAGSFYPKELSRYEIFGDAIHSPCDGRVEAAVTDLPDHIPPATDRERVAGNHVVVACQGSEVLLAHMRNGSVAVHVGESVQAGQMLGRVGNSGNTSEPHLHIHAVRAGSGGVLKGEGVPILFDGEFPVRNTTVKRRGEQS
jgi:hypothetical protein